MKALLLGTNSMESSIEREGNGIVCEFGNFCMRDFCKDSKNFPSIFTFLIFDWFTDQCSLKVDSEKLELQLRE